MMTYEPRIVRTLYLCLCSLLPIGLALLPAAAVADEHAAHEMEHELEPGRELFTEEALPKCSVCHTLADAKAKGKVGPNLDQLKPDLDRVKAAVTSGPGVMPSYDGKLSPEEIEAIALYVSTVAGQPKG